MSFLNLDQDICPVIRAARVVKLALRGDHALRTFELHIVHVLDDDARTTILGGNEVLDPGEPSERREWNEFRFDFLIEFRPTSSHFQPDRKFSSFVDDYGQVYCAVDRP